MRDRSMNSMNKGTLPHVLRFLGGLLLMISQLACEPEAVNPCHEGCPTGYECTQEGLCLVPQLQKFDGDGVPGRRLAMAMGGGKLVTVTEDPETQKLVIGEGNLKDGLSFFKWDRKAESSRQVQALELSGAKVLYQKGQFFMLWLDRDGYYHWATKEAKEALGRWRIERITTVLGVEGTSDFTFTVTPAGKAMVFYHDNKGGLSLLSRGIQDSGHWEASTVVMQPQVPLARNCTRLGLGRSSGIGLHPSAAAMPEAVRGGQVEQVIEVAIAHYDADCGSLLVTMGQVGRWETHVVDEGQPLGAKIAQSHVNSGVDVASRSNVGAMNVIRINARRDIGIAYHDESLGILKYASYVGEKRWRTEVVDDGSYITRDGRTAKAVVGGFPSLQFNALGNPEISYQDATLHRIKFASRGFLASDWTFSQINFDSNVGFWQMHVSDPDMGRVIGTELWERPKDDSGIRSKLRLKWD